MSDFIPPRDANIPRWQAIVSRVVNAQGGGGGTTTNALTFNNGGAGVASGGTFDGSAAVTVSYNSVGAAATSHNHSAADLTSGTLAAARMPALTGDITTSAGAVATTLATVNGNAGSFGSSIEIPVITVNAKGLVTAVSTATIPAGILTRGLVLALPSALN